MTCANTSFYSICFWYENLHSRFWSRGCLHLALHYICFIKDHEGLPWHSKVVLFKDHDKLFQTLRRTSPEQFVTDSVRARQLCLTTERYKKFLFKKRLPSTPCPLKKQPYHAFGRGRSKSVLKNKYKAACRTICGLKPRDLGEVTYKHKLSAARLQSWCPCLLPFATRQVLSDFALEFGHGLVSFEGSQAGTGVKLGDWTPSEDDLQKMCDMLNSSSSFRINFGGSIVPHMLTHLICELRQHSCPGKKFAALVQAVKNVNFSRLTAADLSEKASFISALMSTCRDPKAFFVSSSTC